jgi:peptidoglycan/LPS O-acetylase OafA/YrhL
LTQASSSSSSEEQQSRRPDQKYFRTDIEGLRAVAVLAVVLFHAEMPGFGGGFVGVDVFFVISGFLITGLLWREATSTGTVRLRNFYGARARRLLPASALVGVITMIASFALLSPLQVPSVMQDGITSALYVGNVWFIMRGVDYFATPLASPFQHYWSLGVEEQFYLVWPVLILGTAWLIRLTRRRTRTQAVSSPRPYLIVLTLVVAVSFALSVVITYWAPPVAFFSLPTRAWQLGAGALVALTTARWNRLSPRAAAITGWTGLAMILLACTWFSTATPSPGIAALLPTLGTVLVIGAGCALSTQGCGRILGIAPMRAIGRISYSWYLWHWPVLVLAPIAIGQPLGLAARLAAALLSAALAVLTLRLIENPLRFATPIRRSARASLALGAGVTAVAVAVGQVLLGVVPVLVGHGTPATPLTVTAAPVPPGSGLTTHDAAIRQAFDQVQTALTASANLGAVPSNLDPSFVGVQAEQAAYAGQGCLLSPLQGEQPECASGDTASPTTVALIGDSHAAIWNPAFQQIAEQRHWRLVTLAKAACPVLDLRGANPFRRLVELVEHCEQWRAHIMDRLAAERPKLVVVSVFRGYGVHESLTGFTSFDPEWIDSLTRLVQRLRGFGARVLVLGPVPDLQLAVPICLSKHLDDATACSASRPAAVNAPGIAAESAATEVGGGRYDDLTELFCTTDRCPSIVGNTMVYVDSSHLTFEYSRLLAPVIGALADRALVE